ncbi:hypothetical protein DUNSADRAFT_14520 [Dunaliella salina]|uniref:3'-5' exonuclease n=1 Tax=Dunaliella salina TaxID=3046 RepID=A0ABQ7G7C7_DUNSA|nr:hypothetical protein DUNSADRAFT_14520 [Dunaliella salina]|eukprot:KAF5830494.1 hypothetical protein DUNSADRAFT_14520 [Dunaliella salina]
MGAQPGVNASSHFTAGHQNEVLHTQPQFNSCTQAPCAVNIHPPRSCAEGAPALSAQPWVNATSHFTGHQNEMLVPFTAASAHASSTSAAAVEHLTQVPSAPLAQAPLSVTSAPASASTAATAAAAAAAPQLQQQQHQQRQQQQPPTAASATAAAAVAATNPQAVVAPAAPKKRLLPPSLALQQQSTKDAGEAAGNANMPSGQHPCGPHGTGSNGVGNRGLRSHNASSHEKNCGAHSSGVPRAGELNARGELLQGVGNAYAFPGAPDVRNAAAPWGGARDVRDGTIVGEHHQHHRANSALRASGGAVHAPQATREAQDREGAGESWRTLPGLEYHGEVRYAGTEAEIAWQVSQLMELDPEIVSLDLEWWTTFTTGVPPRQTALIQLAFETGDPRRCCAGGKKEEAAHFGIQGGPPSGLQSSSAGVEREGTATSDPSSSCRSSSGSGEATPCVPSNSCGCRMVMKGEEAQQATKARQASMEHAGEAALSNTGAKGVAERAPEAGSGQAAADPRKAVHSLGRRTCCLLLHVAGMKRLPRCLRMLLEAERPKKVGVNLAGDAAKLKTDFGWDLAGRVDLAELATTRCFAHRELVTTDVNTPGSLSGLVESALHHHLPKPQGLRCGQWERRPLSSEQIMYATLDAFAGLAVFHALQSCPLRRDVIDSGRVQHR